MPQPAPSSDARVRVAVLHVPGTNRDPEAALACELAGADEVDVVICTGQPGDRVAAGRIAMADLVVLPGGFSFGDDLGAGRLLARALVPGVSAVGDALAGRIERGAFVLGICNGFQALLKSGLLPGRSGQTPKIEATLAANASGQFECRWVTLRAEPDSCCPIIARLVAASAALLCCPVAHAEGRFVPADEALVEALADAGQIALRYAAPDGAPLSDTPRDAWPHNPNGSVGHVAGISNARGNVLGLMPHPENHLFDVQRPASAPTGVRGLALFEAAIACARQHVASGDRA